jgi:AraC family transcriptional regulator, melibiose operon regulatory protein
MSDQEIQTEPSSSLLGWYGQPWEVKQLHRHNDIELNFVAKGEIQYLFAGQIQTVKQNQMLIFWAVTPHRLMDCTAKTEIGVIHIPLREFLRWKISNLENELLQTKWLIGQDPDPSFDQKLFLRWANDLQITTTPKVHHAPLEQHTIVLLELEARLRRQARTLQTPRVAPVSSSSTPLLVQQLAQMIAERHDQNLPLNQLIKDLDIHPNYAMNLFQKHFGLTIHQYLVQHRIAHAQRLLITSQQSILDCALDSGFGSLSQFYQAFKELTGYSPKQYRKTFAR